MSCGCQSSPCSCDGSNPECPTPAITKCDRYIPGTKNVWVERGDTPNDVNALGVCMLDTMCEEQVIESLRRDEQAREDLLKVTSDPRLLELARTVPRLPVVETMDAEQAYLNRSNTAESIPFYAIFRGQPPFSQ
jgi:hypothetical protein